MTRAKLNLEQGKVRVKTLAAILAVLVLGAVGFFIIQAGGGNSGATEYRKAGDQFMASITGGNFEAAYNLMTDNLQEERSKDAWLTALGETFKDYTDKAEFIEISSQDLEKAYKESGTYPLRYRLRSGDKTFVVFIGVSKRGTSWKVSEFLNNTQFIDAL